jgi:hypothetical protein
MLIVAIDPGSEESAYVMFDVDLSRVVAHGIESNEIVVSLCATAHYQYATLVVEQFESYGMAVGAEVFRTVWWSGRFHQAWRGRAYQLPRKTVKSHLCHSTRATDANVRQAILDRFARTKAEAIGKKAAPGPLYGLKGHEFAALGVALTWADLHGTTSNAGLPTDSSTSIARREGCCTE